MFEGEGGTIVESALGRELVTNLILKYLNIFYMRMRGGRGGRGALLTGENSC